MPERWLAWCRRLVPEPWREATFDPAVADLLLDWASEEPAKAPGPWRRRVACLRVALECRRLAAHAAPARPHAGSSSGGQVMRPFHDVFHAARRLARQPIFAVVSVVTLALGIGANLTLFGFVDAMLLAPIASAAPGELVRVSQRRADGGADIVSYLNYRDLRDGVRSLDLAAHKQVPVEVGSGDATAIRTAELVTGNYFGVLGLAPLSGRLLDQRDDRAELASAVVVLGEPYWQSAFGGDADVVGRTILINGAPFEIVGVAPRGFRGTYNAHPIDFWLPVMMQQIARPRGLTLDRRGWGWLDMIGRVAPGTRPADLDADLTRVARDLDARFPESNTNTVFVARPAVAMSDDDRRALAPVLTATYAFTVLLFVVTCANLGGLMHARLSGRRRELAIRQSLGAGRRRLVWEWMTESILIAACGAALGVLAARATSSLIVSLELPAALANTLRLAAPSSARVFGYGAALAGLAALIFGAWPAWRAGKADAAAFLRADGTTSVGEPSRARGRRVAVAVQMALSAVLLVAAGFLAASVGARSGISPGFSTDHLGLMAVSLERKRVPEGQWRALGDLAISTLRSDPSVVFVDLAFRAPLAPGADQLGFRVPGYVGANGTSAVSIDFNIVGAGYFESLGVPFVSGRVWDPSAAARAPLAVVNETLAARFYPGVDPVGRSIEVRGAGMATISGVVRDTAYYSLGESPLPYIYLPAEARMPSPWVLHVRTRDDLASTLPRLARRLAEVDPRLAPFEVMPFEELGAVPLFPARMLAFSALAFGAVALVLTAVGLYGVVSASVGRRRREIALRLALGAHPVSVLGGVLGEAGAVAAAGAAVGLLGGSAAAGALQGWLFGAAEPDVRVYVVVCALLAVVTLAAAWFPARRAARTDINKALRE